MHKSFFPLTAHLADHPKFGEIWQIIFKEYELTKQYILRLSGKTELMDDYPIEQQSHPKCVEDRNYRLLTIQQYSMIRVREMEEAIINAPW